MLADKRHDSSSKAVQSALHAASLQAHCQLASLYCDKLAVIDQHTPACSICQAELQLHSTCVTGNQHTHENVQEPASVSNVVMTAHLLMQGVGKSCLVLRYVRNQFDPSSKITVSNSSTAALCAARCDFVHAARGWCSLCTQDMCHGARCVPRSRR
jgi:hypothetical protein